MDSQGRVWMASEVGLIRLQNGTFTSWNTGNSNITTDEIRQVAGSTDGSTIWLMDRGLNTLQRYQNGSFTLSASQNVGYNFTTLSADNQGNAWISLTHDGNGLGPMGAIRANTNAVTYFGEFSSRILDTWDGTVFNDEAGGIWFTGPWGATHFIASSDLSVSLSNTDVSCNGGTNGSVSASISGGTPPYEYFWYRYGYASYTYGNEEYFFQQLNVNDLPAVPMTFFVRDAAGLTAGAETGVSQPNALRATVESINANTLEGSGSFGTPPYQYAWSNGTTTATANNLGDGTHGLTITDANGCTDAATGFVGTVPTGYCVGNGNTPWNSYISNVQLGTINGATGKNPDGGTLNASESTNLEKGATMQMEVAVRLPYSSATFYVRAWIDWNRNGNFEASELVFDESETGSNTYGGAYNLMGNVQVPYSATNGNSMMRVILKVGSAPDVCDSGIVGEVENYPVHIKDGTGGNCAITSSLVDVECFDNNTPNDPLDDRYSFTVLVEKTGNCGGTWFDFTTGQTGNYGVPTTFASVPVTLNMVNVVIGDSQNPVTAAPLLIQSPGPCSNGGGGTCNNNLLQNPSFNSGSSAWQGDLQITNDANTAPSAIRACTAYMPVRQTIAAQGNTNYNLEVFAKEDNGTNGLIYVKFLTSAWSVINTEYYQITSTSYSKINQSLTSPSNAAWAEIGILKENGTGCIYADDWCFGTGGGSSGITLNCPADLTVNGSPGGGMCQGFDLVPEPTVSTTCPQGGATYSFQGFTVVSGNPNVQDLGSSGACPGIHFTGAGTADITFTASDACGNTTTCTFRMTRNVLFPSVSFDNCPSNITVMAAAGQNSAIVTYPTLTATVINCPNPTNIGLQSPPNTASGSAFPIGQTMVAWRAYGCNQTEAVCTFEVIVEPFSGGGGCTNNLLQNADFASNGTNWNENGQGITYITGANANQGTSASICNTGSRIYQTINVTGGKTYTLEAQTKRTQNARGLLVIKYLDASWTPLLQDFFPAENGSYALTSGSLAAPAAAVRAEVSFYHNGGTGCVFADDFCFSENGGGGCVLSPTISNIQCDDLGTSDPNDDIFTADLTVTGGSAATYLYFFALLI